MENQPINQQWNYNLKPQPRLGIFGILRESFKTIKRNGKLLLPILVLVFLLFTHLEFAQTYLLAPVAKDLSSKLASNPNMFQDFGNKMHQANYTAVIKDIREVILVKLFMWIILSIITLFFLVATISSSYEAYTAKVIDFKEMIMKIKKSWKKPIVTSVYMTLILMGLFFVVSISCGMLSILAGNSGAYISQGVFIFAILVLGIYICALWMMSLVVSVTEDVGGLNAIGRARELMKGKKLQASLILVLFSITYGVSISFMAAVLSSCNLENWSLLAISIPFSNGLWCALKLLAYVVFTIFYHERKESFDEKEAKGQYVPIVTDEVV